MSREARTLSQLYQEWTVGLPGRPSVMYLDLCHGPSWRSRRNSEVQFYSLRSKIIKEVRRVAIADGVSEAAAVERVQERQMRERWSLDRLAKALRREAKVRGAEKTMEEQRRIVMAEMSAVAAP